MYLEQEESQVRSQVSDLKFERISEHLLLFDHKNQESVCLFSNFSSTPDAFSNYERSSYSEFEERFNMGEQTSMIKFGRC